LYPTNFGICWFSNIGFAGKERSQRGVRRTPCLLERDEAVHRRMISRGELPDERVAYTEIVVRLYRVS
jgi:hypothetical protein